jgi:hypothetical protein
VVALLFCGMLILALDAFSDGVAATTLGSHVQVRTLGAVPRRLRRKGDPAPKMVELAERLVSTLDEADPSGPAQVRITALGPETGVDLGAVAEVLADAMTTAGQDAAVAERESASGEPAPAGQALMLVAHLRPTDALQDASRDVTPVVLALVPRKGVREGEIAAFDRAAVRHGVSHVYFAIV